MTDANDTAKRPLPNAKSHALKLGFLWTAFVLAVTGTYLLSHEIELRSTNLAAVFASNGRSHEIGLYSGKADPISVEAWRGDEVLFIVKDDSRHDIAEERTQKKDARLDSGEIGKDESYSLIFQNKGKFSFYDRLNQDIRVTITIK